MRTPMPWPMLLVFSLLAALSSPPTLAAQVLSSGHTSSFTPDTTQHFDSETGLPLSERSTQPQELPTDREPGAWESAKLRQLADGMLKPLQSGTREPYLLQFIFGLPNNITWGLNLALSYGLSYDMENRDFGNINDSFYLYPALRLGFLMGREIIINEKTETESLGYGMIEGYRHFGQENFRISSFVGVGVGGYRHSLYERRSFQDNSMSEKSGIGLVLSTGVQVRVWRILGELRLYRTPGFSKLLAFANVGVQTKSYTEALIVAGVGVIPLAWLVFLQIFPGS